jgi:hypothetical protein
MPFPCFLKSSFGCMHTHTPYIYHMLRQTHAALSAPVRCRLSAMDRARIRVPHSFRKSSNEVLEQQNTENGDRATSRPLPKKGPKTPCKGNKTLCSAQKQKKLPQGFFGPFWGRGCDMQPMQLLTPLAPLPPVPCSSRGLRTTR